MKQPVAAWLSVIIGLVTGMLLIVASIWWAVKPPGARSKSLIPKASDNRPLANDIPRERGSGDDD